MISTASEGNNEEYVNGIKLYFAEKKVDELNQVVEFLKSKTDLLFERINEINKENQQPFSFDTPDKAAQFRIEKLIIEKEALVK